MRDLSWLRNTITDYIRMCDLDREDFDRLMEDIRKDYDDQD